LDLRNLTPYPHLPAVLYDERGREVLVVVLKASFRLSSGEPHPEPLPVHAAEVLFASGAVRYPADLVPSKRGTDVVCNGAVHAPGGAAVASCAAELRIGDVRAAVRAFGRRTWRRAGDGWRLSEPEPFRAVALGMESAFGGRGDGRNPVGRGYVAPGEAGGAEGRELPSLERAAESERIRSPDDRPAPAGFAAVSARWEPRRSFAGSFGEAWRRTRAPLLPEDMDARFWNAAQLTSARELVGGEPVELVNLTPGGRMEARLPRVPVRVRVEDRDVRPALDLVLLEPEADRVALTLRVSIDVTGRLDGRLPKVRIMEKRIAPLGRRAVR
jgi:hypothetical protein